MFTNKIFIFFKIWRLLVIPKIDFWIYKFFDSVTSVSFTDEKSEEISEETQLHR